MSSRSRLIPLIVTGIVATLYLATLSRHYTGDGVIDFGSLTRAVVATGYDRDIEVEIFNADVWADDPAHVVRRSAQTFGEAVAPHVNPVPVP